MTQYRCEIVPQARSMVFDAPNALGRCSGAVRERVRGGPGTLFGRLLAALGLPGASQDQPLGDICPSTSRPERVRMRPRNGLERPKRPNIEFWSIFNRFGQDFHRFFVDFSLAVRTFGRCVSCFCPRRSCVPGLR